MNYFLLFTFSNITLFVLMLAGSSNDLLKTGKATAFSIMPGIPVLPSFFVIAVLIFEKTGFSSSLKIAFIIHSIIFTLSVLFVIYANVKTRNT